MKMSIEIQRDDLRQRLPRDLMKVTGHHGHSHELEAVVEVDGEVLEGDPHRQLVVVWCVADTCKQRSPRGTAVGSTHVCLLTRCTLCHPVTWWERLTSTIRIAFR